MNNDYSGSSPDARRLDEEEKEARLSAQKRPFDFGDFHSKLNSISKAIDNNEKMMDDLGNEDMFV